MLFLSPLFLHDFIFDIHCFQGFNFNMKHGFLSKGYLLLFLIIINKLKSFQILTNLFIFQGWVGVTIVSVGMYGAAVPPPVSSSMHPSMEYNMTVPVAMPQFDYGVVNGPSMDMVMMGGNHSAPPLPLVHPSQSYLPNTQGYNQYSVTSQTYAPTPLTSTYTPSYSAHPNPGYMSMSQQMPAYDQMSMMNTSPYISTMQPQPHQVNSLSYQTERFPH